jgi:catechol 2,3-dioxygenase-like lactoylglutathione lyase family enzyme
MPIGHLGLAVPDLAVARSYYDRVLPALGYEPFLVDDDQFAYRPVDGKVGTFLFVYPAPEAYDPTRAGLQHLAFIVRTRAEVDAVHDLAVGLGSEVVHPPREWPEYPPPYYATFWKDPHGFLLEAVCHHDR